MFKTTNTGIITDVMRTGRDIDLMAGIVTAKS